MEYISLGDTVYFGATIHHPSGGYLVNADETPKYFAFVNETDTPLVEGNFTTRGIPGTYRGKFNVTSGNGFLKGNYVEIHASGKVDGVVGRAILKSFVINDVFDANIVQVSGEPATPMSDNAISSAVLNAQLSDYTSNGTVGSGLNKLIQDIYFAGIKFVKDTANAQDEYAVQWFKNSIPLNNGAVTNPALSVQNLTGNTALFENAILTYNNVATGTLRYNASQVTASGEVYIVIASGTIDGQTRIWSNPIGIDYL